MRNSSSRRRRMSGGADESLAQGKNFLANQAGGGNVYQGAPVLAGGDAMLLDGDLRGQAGVGSLDASTAAIRGMQDGGRRRNNNMSARRRRNNNMSARRRRNNNMSARRRRNNNMSMRRRREEQYGGEGEEYEDAITPLQRRRNNMYGGSHSLLPADYASVNQSPALISGGAAARAGTAFTNDPFANGSGSA